MVRGTTVVMWFSPTGLCTQYYTTSYGCDQCHTNKRNRKQTETKKEEDETRWKGKKGSEADAEKAENGNKVKVYLIY